MADEFQEFVDALKTQKGAMAGAPPGTSGGLGDAYRTDIADPARSGIASLLNMGPTAGMPSVGRGIADVAVPGSLTELGATLGSLAVPEAKLAEVVGSGARNAPMIMNFLKRIAGPTIGGAVGGLAEKGDPTDAAFGGVLGTIFGVPAEAAAALKLWTAKSGMARRLIKEDPERVGRVVNKLIPEFPTLASPEDFQANIFRGYAKDKLSEAYGNELGAISQEVTSNIPKVGVMRASQALRAPEPTIIPGGRITSPRIRELQAQGIISKDPQGGLTFDDLTQEIRDLRLEGRSTKGDPKVNLEGRQAQGFARDLSTDLKGALETIPDRGPAIGERYRAMDEKFSRGSEMLRYLRHEGMVDENGQVNMKLLQQQMKFERAIGLSHTFKPEEFQQLADAVFRGGPDTVEDVIRKFKAPPVSEGASGARFSVTGLLDFLRGNQYAGTPEILGSGGYKPRGTALGLQRGTMGISDLLSQGTGASADPPNSLRRSESE